MAIPAGFAFNLHPAITATTSATGSILSALAVTLIGEKIRNRIIQWRYKGKEPKKGFLSSIWDKYGVIGLGLLSPLLFGAPIGAALGAAFGSNKWRLLLWMSVGIIIWAAGLTLAVAAGVDSIKRLF
ncbi:MAG: VTT domain-containing protein [Candidatus Bathyarchaeota archaeon]|nr:VTT domain-containing protein [Candidatus Bathyarchaeota archaeon]